MEAELRRCRSVADSLARVACYDAIVLPARPGIPGVEGAASAPSAGSQASASPPPVGTPLSSRDFGLSQRSTGPVAESIESRLDGDFLGWTPGEKLRLANGQIWEIVDGSTASYRLRDPKVRISRGVLGGFFLHIEGVAQAPRVRRLQ